MGYNPGVQDISGQLRAQGKMRQGQGVADGIRSGSQAYMQHKMMAGQAIAKFEGAARSDPEILKFLEGPGASPEASKSYKKLLKDGSVGVRDAAVLAQFADSYLNEKTQREKLKIMQQENMLRFASMQGNQPTVMSIEQLKQQYPHDQYDAQVVPVPGQPGMVQVKGVSPRAPQNNRITPVPMGDRIAMVDTAQGGKVVAEHKVGASVPQGYEQTPEGGLKPIAGGPAEAEAKAKEASSKEAAGRESRRVGVMRDTIKQALEKVNRATAGVGSILKALPETDARDLAAKLDTLKANIGFKQLEEMRKASPTGGALGQVAVQELAYLQAVEGNLDQAQSPEQLRETLQKIDQSLDRMDKVMNGVTPNVDEDAKKKEEEASKPTQKVESILKKYGIQ